MNEFLKFLKGKKTYIIAGVMTVLGFFQGMGWFIVPDWVWAVLAGLGLTTLRAGVNTIAGTIKKK